MKNIFIAVAILGSSGTFVNSVSAHNGVDHTKSMSPNHDGSMKMSASMHKMMTEMKSMKMTGNVDDDFAQMMVRHHQSGIDMAQMEIEHGTNSDLKAMAKKMIGDQSREQEELTKWIDKQAVSKNSSLKK